MKRLSLLLITTMIAGCSSLSGSAKVSAPGRTPIKEKKPAFQEIYEKADYSTLLTVVYEYEMDVSEIEIQTDKEGGKTEKKVAKKKKISDSAQLSGFVFQHEKNQKFYIGTAGHIQGNYKIITILADFKNNSSTQEMNLLKYTAANDSDVAMLGFVNPDYIFKGNTAKLGNSDTIKPLDNVMAIGSRFRVLYHTPTTGIVVATQTPEPHKIVHTAILHPGVSGGPLINEDGRVIGVNTNVITTTRTFSQLSLASPINDFKKMADAFVEKESKTEKSPP